MKFATASRMRPRWLVLAMMVGEDALFLHYKVPTIVMSRSCDQNNKVSVSLLLSFPIAAGILHYQHILQSIPTAANRTPRSVLLCLPLPTVALQGIPPSSCLAVATRTTRSVLLLYSLLAAELHSRVLEVVTRLCNVCSSSSLKLP